MEESAGGPPASARATAGYAWSIALVAIASAAATAIDLWLRLPDVALLYVAAIMVSAAWHGRGPSILAAALSVAAFNFFLVPPRFTFEVAEPRYILTFTMMFGVGLVISGLTSRLRTQQIEAAAREANTHSLYGLGRALSSSMGPDQVARIIVEQARRAFATTVDLLDVRDTDGALWRTHASAVSTAVARRTPTRSADGLAVPLVTGDAVHGVLWLADAGARDRAVDPDFLESFARQCATAMAQARAADEATLADRRARAEEVRSTLLAAVSHDLRTPLAVITGAASTLRDQPLAAEQRDELLATVCDEAERLEQMVGNLLEMTRLHAGGVVLQAQWVPLEEIVGSALLRLERRLAARPVVVALDPRLPLLWVDPVLLEQVLVNLVDNGIKYTPADAPIELHSFVRDDDVVVQLKDHGPGMPPGLGARAFEKFVRGRGQGRDGFGLGLAICSAIVELHGGRIAALAQDGGGTCMEFTVPRRSDQPPADVGALFEASA